MDTTQRVSGSVQNIGPQPVPAATAMGTTSDAVAINPGNSSMNAKLGALMVQNTEIITLLEAILEALTTDPDGRST